MKTPASSRKSHTGSTNRTPDSARRSTSSNSREKLKHSERKQLLPERQLSNDANSYEKPFLTPTSAVSFRKAVEDRFAVHYVTGTSPENDYPVTLNHKRDRVEETLPVLHISTDDIENQHLTVENADYSYSYPQFPPFPTMIPGYPVPLVPPGYPMNLQSYTLYPQYHRTDFNTLLPLPYYGYISPPYFQPEPSPHSTTSSSSTNTYAATGSYPTAQNNNISVTNYNYPSPGNYSPSPTSNQPPYYPSSPPRYGYIVPSVANQEQPVISSVSPLRSQQDISDLQATLHPSYTPAVNPGPTIKLGETLKGPKGCNLFVFHLPNETTNW
jgi:hypothetical protein